MGNLSDIVGVVAGMQNPMTTDGDLIIGGGDGNPARLAAGSDGDVCTIVSGVPAWAAASGGSLLVAETVVSGSAVTSVTFSDLDGNAAGGYIATLSIKNGYNGVINIQCFANNDLTPSNYITTLSGSYGSGGPNVWYGQGSEVAYCVLLDALNDESVTLVEIGITSGNKFQFHTQYARKTGLSTQEAYALSCCKKDALSANLTRLDFVASQANGIAVGSILRLYKRK